MWSANLVALGQGCAAFGVSPENTAAQNQEIYECIHAIAETTLVDRRFVLAAVTQEVP
jgi:hypothetical protein